MEDFTSALTTRFVRDSPTTTVDAKNALAIYGSNVAVLKGENTRTKPTSVITESIILVPQEILQLNKSVAVCTTFFYFDELVFFCSVSGKICHGTAQFVDDMKDDTKRSCIKQLHSTYTNRGFTLDHMLTDFEFESMWAATTVLGIKLNTTSASEHVGDIERFIRVLKERIRGFVSTLPFTKYPKMMKIEMVHFYLFWLNIFPRKGGISDHFDPVILVDGTEANFNVQCRVPFGSYCQTHEENTPTNTNAPRTIGAIALSHSGNLQGGYKFLSLSTGHMVHRRRWTELPIPLEIVDMVDEMVERENHNSHDLDLTLQGYTYVHDSPPVHNPSPDGTDYNDDEPDIILYPHDYIDCPEAGTTAVPTGDEENIPTGNNDEDTNSENINNKHSNEFIEAVPLGTLRMIMFIKRKRCGRIKARDCADGRKQRNYIPKEDASSPTVSTESLMISCILDTKEILHVAICDIDGAF